MSETAQQPLVVENLTVEYTVRHNGRRHTFAAVQDVSLTVGQCETVAVVGESGSGKTTLARAIMRLEPAARGRLLLDGTDYTHLGRREMKDIRTKLQMVFQDADGSLDPHMRVGEIISEPLRLNSHLPRDERRERVGALLSIVGLDPAMYDRRPGTFSGGQRRRIGLARALASTPSVLVCDEPTSGLDVSVQSGILQLLRMLQEETSVASVFISHDLSVVRQHADSCAVMYLGRIVEQGPVEELFASPRHPYTKSLLHVVPDPRASKATAPRAVLSGEMPSVLNPPTGCPFRSRCPLAVDRCAVEMPPLAPTGPRSVAACWRAADVPAWVPSAVPVAAAS